LKFVFTVTLLVIVTLPLHWRQDEVGGGIEDDATDVRLTLSTTLVRPAVANVTTVPLSGTAAGFQLEGFDQLPLAALLVHVAVRAT